MSRPRLNKEHGFLHHIKQNQIDRNKYHEEKKKVTQGRRVRDDDRDSYQNRRNRNSSRDKKPAYMTKPDKDGVVFTLTVEYCPEKTAVLKVRQGDDASKVSKDFTAKYGMREDLSIALKHIVCQKMGITR